MTNTIRTFIAVELPENIISHIRKVQEGLKKYRFNARWVAPENIHLTLKFLGNISISDTDRISSAMSDTVRAYSPISLSAKGIGVFPGIKRARVIWIGLRGDTHMLIELQKTLDKNLQTIGFPKEDRPFKAHLTLARTKDRTDPEKLAEAMKEFSEFESETFMADRIILFKSDLKPGGAVYTKLNETMMVNDE